MHKKSTIHLLKLVRSMSRSEKRHFRLFSQRISSNEDALFIQLFNYLEKGWPYSEERLLNYIPRIKKRQLSNIKAHLYNQILTSMRMLHTSHDAEMAIREQYDFAYVLYSKGFYRESLDLLEKTKEKARLLQRTTFVLDIIAFEKLIESQYITRSIDTRAVNLAKESVRTAKLAERENRFSNLSLQLYGVYLQTGFARSQADIEKLKETFQKYLPKHNENDLNFYERLFLYQSYVWLYYMTHDFSKLYRYSFKWVNLFSEFPELLQTNIPLYLKGLHNLLSAQFLTLQYNRFDEYLKELLTFNSDKNFVLTQNESSLLKLFGYIHRINNNYLFGTFTEGANWIGELEDVLEKHDHTWDYHREMVFYYRIACIYFGSGNNEKAIDFLNKIINRQEVSFRGDIQSFARILSLIAHYELGNEQLLIYQIKSVYRFLLKTEELNGVHKAIFQFLRKMPTVARSDIRSAFIELSNKLKSIEQDPFERRSFLYLDIISWLESKIEGVSVEEVIRRKVG